MSVDGAFGGIKSIGCVSQVGLRGLTRKIDSCMQDSGDTKVVRIWTLADISIFAFPAHTFVLHNHRASCKTCHLRNLTQQKCTRSRRMMQIVLDIDIFYYYHLLVL